MASSRKLSLDTLTERWLRELGWEVGQCWRQTGPVKHDLYGIADQAAFFDGMHLLVQTTSANGGHMASHRRDLLAHENSQRWKQACASNLLYLVGWYEHQGERPPRVEEIQWDCLTAKIVSVKLDDPIAHLDVRDPRSLARARGKS